MKNILLISLLTICGCATQKPVAVALSPAPAPQILMVNTNGFSPGVIQDIKDGYLVPVISYYQFDEGDKIPVTTWMPQPWVPNRHALGYWGDRPGYYYTNAIYQPK